ncbi:MAG: carboxypeptidase regulatory-like domain-containing protein, partial [Pirellulaceae bacterium]|nr:carboxypeptidase regulatory-like domain-containing protein [Pirellulaceae bacterium]
DVAAAVPNSPDQELRILAPREGVYYVGIHGSRLLAGSTGYTLSAARSGLEIREVSPGTVGNAGRATIKVVGDNFDPEAQVRLVAPGGAAIEAEEYYQDGATLFATFDLAGSSAAPGSYGIEVANLGGELVIRTDAVTVVEGGEAAFKAQITMPSMTRPGRVVQVRVEYTNPGLVDITSPILTLTSNHDDVQWQVPGSDEWITNSTLRLLGLSGSGPVTVLRPGQTETLLIPLRIPFRPEYVRVDLSSLGATATDGSNTLIDWKVFEAEVRPATMDDDTWAPVLANLQSQIGTTWGDYAVVLRQNSRRWFEAGQLKFSVFDLFQMEMDEARSRATGFVSGRVVGAGEEPMQNVVITAFDETGKRVADSRTTLKGEFALYGVPAGGITLVVNGYLVQSGDRLVVPNGEDIHNIQVTVTEAAHVTGVMISAEDGIPVINSLVMIVGASRDFSQATVTDSTGQYEFPNLPAGVYFIQSIASGYAPLTTDQFTVDLGQTLRLNIGLSSGASVAGNVRDTALGTAISGATVIVRGQSTGYVTMTTTDGEGRYLLSDLPTDTYLMEVSATGFAPRQLNGITLTAGNEAQEQDFVLGDGAFLSGYVLNDSTDEPIAHASVTVYDPSGTILILHADATGQYSLAGLRPGSWRIQAQHPGFVTSAHDIINIIA